MIQPNNIISKLCNLLSPEFQNHNNNLEEQQEKMCVAIKNDGVNFLSYSYDKIIKGETKNLLPFLAKNKDVHSMCDYVLFCEYKKQLFI